ncbi:uncharacterized protein [Ptychodera flava]|uniref:uncharacterized protein n=1 Tax=Ptychodera flava TaxID=63121 RepID=UPI00396A6DA5
MAEFPRIQTQLWLLDNYHVVSGAQTKLNDVINHLQQFQRTTAVKYLFRDSIVGGLIHDLWHDDVNTRRCLIPGTFQRTRIFTNFCKIDKATLPMYNNAMSWNQLKLYCPSGWTVNSPNDECLVWVKVSTAENTVNGCRILTEVRMDKQKNDNILASVKYGSHTANLENIGLNLSEFFTSDGPTEHQMDSLMTLISKSTFCAGIEGENCRLTESGKREVWTVSNRNSVRLRSKDCELFCRRKADGDLCCSKCQYLKRHLNRKRSVNDSNDKRRKNFKSMDRGELIESLKKEQRRRLNAEAREKLLRQKLENEMLEFDDEDNNDFAEMFRLIDEKQLGDDMKILLEQQKSALSKKNAKAHRWHPRIIRLCLSIYARSPHAYDELANVLILPSKRTLVYKKNQNSQEPGWNYETINGLKEAADEKGLKDVDRWGGLCFDEMSIQEDLQITKFNGKSKLVGIVSLGQAYNDMEKMMKGNLEVVTATHVLQFVFVGDGGFRYPVAHFPTRECPPTTLYRLFWEGVQILLKGGFQ